LASGILTGKYDHGIPADSRMNRPGYEWLRANIEGDEGREKIEKTRKLSQLAKDMEITLPQLAVAWCLKNPHVSSVILGASKASQLDETLKSVDCLRKLDLAVMKKIDAWVG
jgi:aryl-alcohol dehydrogenase-like predicted oxidoreductase